ncbi:MAG: FAD-dependent oxidoreductase, partial [Betaproteobacteria bacterium]|nr:FAD-dependent oxidoreductase [Betaproteobacteria bacterium]
VVVGSGGGGFGAALTARKLGLSVAIVEKDTVYGGTTARSGGALWIPANHHEPGVGYNDSAEAARLYLREEIGDFYDADRIEAFLQTGPKMAKFLEDETEVKFFPYGLPDYHSDLDGAGQGGRPLVCLPYDGRNLGKNLRNLRPPLREITFAGMMFSGSQEELKHFYNFTRSLTSFMYVTRMFLRSAWQILLHGRTVQLKGGNALVARLAKTAFEIGIDIRLSSPARELVIQDGAVRGVVVDGPKGRERILAQKGVVLAAGGFPHDPKLRSQFFSQDPDGTQTRSPSAEGNTGDGINLARSAGGAIRSDMYQPGALMPVSEPILEGGRKGTFPHLVDRYKPGMIAVTRQGVRFCNEANSYHDFCIAMTALGEGSDPGVHIVCDHRALRKYGLGFVKPFPVPYGAQLRNGYLKRGKTVRDLAAAIGVPAEALEKTVARYNEGARSGQDADFGRGSTSYNRFLGDVEHKPNPCVAPLEEGPFYAVRVRMGTIGTYVGISTDRNARVLDGSGKPIPGLYAAGNDNASVFGGYYPGPGITLGPAFTFGYLAAHHLAGKPLQAEPAGERRAAS